MKAANWNLDHEVLKRMGRLSQSSARQDGAAVYRKGNEYLIVSSDKFGVEKIVTYGVNDE